MAPDPTRGCDRPLFNAQALAEAVRAAMRMRGLSSRDAAAEIGVSFATVCRAAGSGGWPTLSHEAFLRIDAWLVAQNPLVTRKRLAGVK